MNSAHRDVTQDPESNDGKHFQYDTHPHLTAIPTDQHGNALPPGTLPQPPPPLPNAHTPQAWEPFADRLEFDFAYCHFVKRQSSADEIREALDLHAAQAIKCGADSHGFQYDDANELYQLIDCIDDINVPWETHQISYHGPHPPTSPLWMTQTYKFVKRDIRQLFLQQMQETDFFTSSTFNKSPYRQFNNSGQHIWSNVMSGDWAWKQADEIAQDPSTHGSMFVPFAAGSDKTTVSVATGHQEYHPVYASPCNLSNVTCRTHPFGMLPVAFLVIPKTTKSQRKKPEYQAFVRQMYHGCLAELFEPLRTGMTTPEVIHCPDGHYRRVVYGIGPYIADYPEQVWLSGVVSGHCPKCHNPPSNLDRPGPIRRTRAMTDIIVNELPAHVAWDDYGCRSDVVPFTHDFLRADIHELMSPDLLHQAIKGTFMDHLVELNAVPAFPGLRRWPDGRDFAQWTGDDTKALMKVYISAIAGYVPASMVKAVSIFLDFCYLAHRNAHTSDDIKKLEELLQDFHHYRQIFIETGVRESISLPRQHALMHYPRGIRLLGSPNGLCTSITESKHIEAVKETWQQSSWHNALDQMISSITRTDKMVAMQRRLQKRRMMWGTTAAYESMMMDGEVPLASEEVDEEDLEANEEFDLGPVSGPATTGSVHLAATPARGYPSSVPALAAHLGIPLFGAALRCYLWSYYYPNAEQPDNIELCPPPPSSVKVFHSAIARFYAPSDICGAGGMHQERIRSHPRWRNLHARYDTVLVDTQETELMGGMTIARVLLFFSFILDGERQECGLVNWF
ncbi:hypothetical protein D9758_009059 [Tetrapyrgos nigripes]|uniref:Uncharacterized protein n=1 Tax=Tetrapyrgos nigripes TaxID=182062 RepID=A0A8H5GA44_9AGAR|nr:hypothetical protein D9758_009059 [Tetrapyrgos nigripes]